MKHANNDNTTSQEFAYATVNAENVSQKTAEKSVANEADYEIDRQDVTDQYEVKI